MAGYRSRDMASNHLPLTPPDSGSGYTYSNIHCSRDYPTYQARHDAAYDYHQQQYVLHQPAQSAYSSAAYQQSMYQSAAPVLPSISSYYEPVGAPILPPIRVQDPVNPYSSNGYQRESQPFDYASREHQKQPAKEEKATGGVSAKLDYDMDRMTDFVASTTQHMYDLHLSPICLADIDTTRSFQQNVTSPPAFRKWVHQVLSATRLPSATILLSLHYLSDRLKIFPDSVPTGENEIYRLLSVALILGSKFLDDNTFINRSWSDVTSIKVSELNSLEITWLGLIYYNLHVEPSCVETWMESWNKYNADQVRERQTRLSPIDTTVSHRPRSRYSPAYPDRAFDTSSRSSHYAGTSFGTDPWAPTERSTYDDYYKRSGNVSRYPTLNDIDDANRRANEQQFHTRYPHTYHTYQALASAPYSTASAPGYVPWDQYCWSNMHRSDCTCSNCAYRAWRPYDYNMGTVMG